MVLTPMWTVPCCCVQIVSLTWRTTTIGPERLKIVIGWISGLRLWTCSTTGMMKDQKKWNLFWQFLRAKRKTTRHFRQYYMEMVPKSLGINFITLRQCLCCRRSQMSWSLNGRQIQPFGMPDKSAPSQSPTHTTARGRTQFSRLDCGQGHEQSQRASSNLKYIRADWAWNWMGNNLETRWPEELVGWFGWLRTACLNVGACRLPSSHDMWTLHPLSISIHSRHLLTHHGQIKKRAHLA